MDNLKWKIVDVVQAIKDGNNFDYIFEVSYGLEYLLTNDTQIAQLLRALHCRPVVVEELNEIRKALEVDKLN